MREARPVPTSAPRTAADDEVDEQSRVEARALKVKRAADEREAEAKGEVGANDAACVEGREAEKRERAESTGAGGGEADFSADGEHDEGEPSGRVGALREFGGRAEVAVDMPGGREGDHDAEREEEPEIVGGIVGDALKDERADSDAGDSSGEDDGEGAPLDLAAPDLNGDYDELDGCGVGERGADGFGDWNVEKQDEQRRDERAGANAGDGDERGDCKSEKEFHGDLRDQ